jgi:MFS family permease
MQGHGTDMNSPSREVSYGWVVIFASLAIHTVGLGAPTILYVALKPIAADLGTLRAVPSLAYSLLMIGAGVGGIAMGWWMDRRGVMQPVLFGGVMIAIGAVVASHADGEWSLYLANGVLIGLLGKSAMIAPLIANATRWFDRRRGLAVAIIASGQGVAGALWPPVIRFVSDGYGWRATFFYYGILALVTMVPLALLLRSPKGGAGGADARRFTTAVRVAGLHPKAAQAVLWLAVIGCCGGMSMPIVHLVSHATDLGMSTTHAANALSLLFAAAFVSRLGFGLLADRIGAMPTLLIGSACQTAMLIGFSMVDTTTGLYVAAVLFGLGFAGIMPCYSLIIRMLFPESQAGWRIASQYLFASSGMAFGGWLGGVVFDISGGYSAAFWVGAGLGVVNFVLVGALKLRHDGSLTPRSVTV